MGGASRPNLIPMIQTEKHTQENTDELSAILDSCRQVIPYLDGKLEAPQAQQNLHTHWLTGDQQDKFTIDALKQDLQQLYPKAGNAYYQARLWHLLCWQPIYIAFISIYTLKKLPDFSGFKQQRQHNAIIGFTLQSERVISGETEQLIKLAAEQIKPILEHYRVMLNTLQRSSIHYTARFNADLILGNLLKVQQFDKRFSEQDVLAHAALWLNYFSLPDKLINTLIVNNEQPIKLIRTSCCQADKINEQLCVDCPKLHKTKLYQTTQKTHENNTLK